MLARDFAAARACVEAPPVADAPLLTSMILEETSEVPAAACWTFRGRSFVELE